MKNIKIICLLLLSSLSFCDDKIMITQFCEHYHRRSYFILRLEKIVNFVQKNAKKKLDYCFNRKQFSDPVVLSCIEKIEKTSSLRPFFRLWTEVKRYKYTENASFAQDFTKLLFVIQHALYSQYTRHKEQIPLDIDFTLKGISYTEATTIRNYYSHRLRHIFLLLKKIPCSKESFFEADQPECDCTFITHHTFTQKEIKKCIESMEKHQTVTPLIELSKEFSCCTLIQNDEFLREFVALTFIVLRNIFLNNMHTSATPIQKTYASHLVYIYQNLDQLPLEEILEAIDLLHKELPPLLEKYEFNSNMKWKPWLKKYWWFPSTLFTVMAIRIYWIFKYFGDKDKPVPANPLLDKDKPAQEGKK